MKAAKWNFFLFAAELLLSVFFNRPMEYFYKFKLLICWCNILQEIENRAYAISNKYKRKKYGKVNLTGQMQMFDQALNIHLITYFCSSVWNWHDDECPRVNYNYAPMCMLGSGCTLKSITAIFKHFDMLCYDMVARF